MISLSEDQREEVREILELSSQLQVGRALTTAVELGYFDRFGEGPRSAREIAAAGSDQEDREATTRLLRLLAATGLIERTEGGYRSAPACERYLQAGGVLDLRPMLRVHHRLYDRWAGFGEVLRTGRSAGGSVGTSFFDRLFAEAMEVRAALTADGVVAELKPVLEGGRFLDLGAGSGGFGRAFIERAGAESGVLTELPAGAEVARSYVAADGMTDVLEVRPMDLRTATEYGSNFDLVFASALLRLFGPDTNRRIMRSAYRALRPGGRLVVFDYFPGEADPWPTGAAVFHLSMYLVTEEGAIYTEDRYRRWMEEAGFEKVRRIDFAEEAALMQGRRPG